MMGGGEGFWHPAFPLPPLSPSVMFSTSFMSGKKQSKVEQIASQVLTKLFFFSLSQEQRIKKEAFYRLTIVLGILIK